MVTAGEPAGIGPELCLQLAGPHADCEIVVVADQQLLRDRAQLLGIDINFCSFNPEQDSASSPLQDKQLKVWHTPLASPSVAGTLNTDNAAYVLNSLDLACDAGSQGCD